MIPVRRAIVIGGGIGGLSTAIGLRQAGVEVTVYERAEAFGDAGAGLTLWANAIKALGKLGLADAALEEGAAIRRAEICRWDGTTLVRIQAGELERLSGGPTIGIHRAALHGVLLAALPGDTVRLGADCTGFEEDASGVTVYFASGRTDRADLLVGADGLHSTIRQQLFPAVALRYSGYVAWRGIATVGDQVPRGSSFELWGCGSRFGIVPIRESEVYWFATANRPPGERQAAAECRDSLRRRFRGWQHPVGRLIEVTPAEEILANDVYDSEPMKEWSRGRVTLLGDAAHPTTPNMGQGACMAIESAVVLARSLSEGSDLSTGLRLYETRRRPRTAWITNQSWRVGRVAQLENPWACAVRDFVVGILPGGIMKKQLERAAGYEV